jgi:ATP-binding cassette, subfamily B, bacterial
VPVEVAYVGAHRSSIWRLTVARRSARAYAGVHRSRAWQRVAVVLGALPGTAPGAPVGFAVRPGGGAVEAPPAVSVREVFTRFWPYTKPYRRWLWLMLAVVVVNPVLDSIAIWLFKILVDDVLTPRDFQPFPRIAAAYLGMTLLMGVVSFVGRYVAAWVGERFLTDLRGSMYRHIHGLSLDFFERRRLGDTLTRLGGDISAIEGVVLSGVTSAASYALRILLYGGALFYLQWQLATVAVLIAPLFWAVSRVFSRRLKDASRENRRNSAAMSAVAEEGLANVALVQAYNRQDSEVHHYHLQSLASMRSQLRSTRLRGLFSPITELIELVGLLLVIGFGTWQLTRGRMTLGELLVFMAYFGQLYSPLRGVGRFANSLSSAAASAERVIEILDLEPSVREHSDPVRLGRVDGSIAVDEVSFRYPGQQRETLSDIAFRVDPGQTVVLVGSSGSGKSTIFKLLLRFYDPTRGTLRIDGHDLRTLDLAQLRENVAVVMQETLVFDGTVEENIRWGRPDATKSQFEAAVAASDVDTFVSRLPDGLATRVGQRGRRLSGGERQRVAIARALLRDAPILLLDEPTTGLDAASGARILGPLSRLLEGRTAIVVSHGLLTVRAADAIHVVERGRIVESGTHERLGTAGGPYERLLRLQQTNARTALDSVVVPVPPTAAWWSAGATAPGGR